MFVRMGPNLRPALLLPLLNVLLHSGHAEDAVLTIEPNWPIFYHGESVILTCCTKDSAVWNYKIVKNSKGLRSNPCHLYSVQAHDAGEYQCCDAWRSTSSTKCSTAVLLDVSADKPRPVLTVSASWPAASVTLSCEVDHPSAGWRFYWYKVVPDRSQKNYIYEPLPGSTNRITRDIGIIRGQTQTAGYACRAGRGHPEYYTHYSEPQFVSLEDVRPESSSVRVQFISRILCGVLLLIVLLLLLRCCIKTKNISFKSFPQVLNICQGSSTLQTADQNESQDYCSLSHADASFYEHLRRTSGNIGSGEPANEYYNLIFPPGLGCLHMNGRRDDAQESSDYNNVNPGGVTGP